MNGGYSLRRRLSIGLVSGVTVMWLVGVVATGFVVRHELDEAFDSALQETAQQLLTIVATDILEHEYPNNSRHLPPLRAHDEYLTFVVRDHTGKILLLSHDADIKAFGNIPKTGFRETENHRVYGEAAVSGTLIIEVAEPLEHRREATLESTISLTVPLVLFLPISVLGVWWLVRRSMHEVLDLRDQIEARGAGDMSAVSTATLPMEVRPIAESVNLLLTRLARSLEAERSFTANAAHELRTPIAGALAQIQRLIASLDDPDLRGRADDIAATLNRLSRISEKLLQLARAEGGGIVANKVNDLAPILDAVVDEFRRNSDVGSRLDYQSSDAVGLSAQIDPDAFGILMRNLIENALKYSPMGTPVRIRAGSGSVTVENTCPVLDSAALEKLKKPFVRGNTLEEGSGLGLTIVQAIAETGGLTVELISPATGRTDGLEVRVRLKEDR